MDTMTETKETTTVDLPRFGELTYAETDVIRFPWGIPGFADQQRWLALSLDSSPGYVWLQSLDDVSVALPAANPWAIFEDYEPRIPPYAYVSLEVRGAEDFTLLCVVVARPGGEPMTMNLAAPIVVNLRTRMARQVSCDGQYSSSTMIPQRHAIEEDTLSAKAS